MRSTKRGLIATVRGETGVAIVRTARVYDEAEGAEVAGGRLVGELKVLAGGRIEVVWAEPSHQSLLRIMAERMNGKASVAMMSEKPGDGFVTGVLVVPRSSPQFVEALWSYLHRYYGLRVV